MSRGPEPQKDLRSVLGRGHSESKGPVWEYTWLVKRNRKNPVWLQWSEPGRECEEIKSGTVARTKPDLTEPSNPW